MPASSSAAPDFTTMRAMRSASAPSAIRTPISCRLLRDRVRHHAVDADDGQRQAERREDRKQDQVESRPGVDAVVEDRVERPHVGDRLVLVDRVDPRDDRARDARRIAVRPDDEPVRRRRAAVYGT